MTRDPSSFAWENPKRNQNITYTAMKNPRWTLFNSRKRIEGEDHEGNIFDLVYLFSAGQDVKILFDSLESPTRALGNLQVQASRIFLINTTRILCLVLLDLNLNPEPRPRFSHASEYDQDSRLSRWIDAGPCPGSARQIGRSLTIPEKT